MIEILERRTIKGVEMFAVNYQFCEGCHFFVDGTCTLSSVDKRMNYVLCGSLTRSDKHDVIWLTADATALARITGELK